MVAAVTSNGSSAMYDGRRDSHLENCNRARRTMVEPGGGGTQHSNSTASCRVGTRRMNLVRSIIRYGTSTSTDGHSVLPVSQSFVIGYYSALSVSQSYRIGHYSVLSVSQSASHSVLGIRYRIRYCQSVESTHDNSDNSCCLDHSLRLLDAESLAFCQRMSRC